MAMPKKYMVLIGLNLVVLLVIFWASYMKAEKEVVKKDTASFSRPLSDAKFFAPQAKADMVCAILLMPKSYLPMLEKFKHRKIARQIQILPGKIDWDNGKMVVLPNQVILKDDSPQMKRITKASREKKNDTQKPASAESKVLQRAAAIYFLKGVAGSKLNDDAN